MSENSASGFGGQGNREWLFDWCQYVPQSPSEKANFDVAMIECWKYEDDEPTKKYELCGFHTETKDSWLKEPTPTRNGRQPSAGFKVAVVPCADYGPLPHLTNGEMQEFHAAFGLPYFHQHYSSIDCGACGMFLQPDNSYVFIMRKTTDWASIGSALRYDPKTNIIRGVFYIRLENISLAGFVKMPEQFINCSHPLLLPLLAVEMTVEEKVSQQTANLGNLDRIEAITGYGLSTSTDTTDSQNDYRVLVKELGQCQTPACHMLDERIEFLLSNIEHINIRSALKERMEAQQTVLFNLIAQADSLINVGLAQDSREMAVSSKQDSSAMKIIALLTTFFLPGTFIASFFAMPLFNWSEPSLHQVANSHFWVYWAVTGPLTLATMAGVIAWAVWNSRRIQLLQSRARESVFDEAKTRRARDMDEKQSPEAMKQSSMPERDPHKKYSVFDILNHRRRHQHDVATAEP
ncbi:uncharacterized protein Triagg1_6731 [Trichoderma aggressivum f. europaeum]|uniref:Uncharacterized protein n=1 Tax=Trichoderma aggressivum f. europaeum TaxID=173218 RepID=A0AAE1IB13_9HYPO|nr:hypothetical protein Triagg1_6731 [Trichoderma aggressivum f. europaeum]